MLWLIPTLWTGLEYVRSELYYLKFSWLNLGYVLPNQAGLNLFVKLGMYGEGFLVMAIVTVLVHWRWFRQLDWKAAGLALLGLWVGVVLLAFYCAYASAARYAFRLPTITITGIQWEFPNDYIVARSLDQAFKKNPESQIFVLSEYTLDGGVPDNLKTWCRTHVARYSRLITSSALPSSMKPGSEYSAPTPGSAASGSSRQARRRAEDVVAV